MFGRRVAMVVAGTVAAFIEGGTEMVSAAVGSHLIKIGIVEGWFVESLADLFVGKV